MQITGKAQVALTDILDDLKTLPKKHAEPLELSVDRFELKHKIDNHVAAIAALSTQHSEINANHTRLSLKIENLREKLLFCTEVVRPRISAELRLALNESDDLKKALTLLEESMLSQGQEASFLVNKLL